MHGRPTQPYGRRPRAAANSGVAASSPLTKHTNTQSQVKSSQVKSSQVKSSQVKSSQVKSSQVKSSQVPVECVVCVGDDEGGGGSDRCDEGMRAREASRAVSEGVVASTASSRGRCGRGTRLRAMIGTRAWRATRTCRRSADGGSGLTGGIKKKKPRRRAKGAYEHYLNNKGKMEHDRAGHAMHEDPALPFGA